MTLISSISGIAYIRGEHLPVISGAKVAKLFHGHSIVFLNGISVLDICKGMHWRGASPFS